ncbi:hypothetical protein CEXT_162061 [Caerostris extrusa]|uniref:Uncharacterized protein n=1 Tax=Caerostris extrusa TaxID=172846 RepID=A0AAV4NRS0_CAEEX|nr:hypothetical protein CEXT_162061 [Caerostris extrusa]
MVTPWCTGVALNPLKNTPSFALQLKKKSHLKFSTKPARIVVNLDRDEQCTHNAPVLKSPCHFERETPNHFFSHASVGRHTSVGVIPILPWIQSLLYGSERFCEISLKLNAKSSCD